MDDSKQMLLDNVLSTVERIEETGDPFNILEFALDIEYTINSRGQYLGATITTATGGPHIEINTRYDKVVGYWGQDCIERGYDDNIGLYDFMEQQAESLTG